MNVKKYILTNAKMTPYKFGQNLNQVLLLLKQK
jgi:hypothetical protein